MHILQEWVILTIIIFAKHVPPAWLERQGQACSILPGFSERLWLLLAAPAQGSHPRSVRFLVST